MQQDRPTFKYMGLSLIVNLEAGAGLQEGVVEFVKKIVGSLNERAPQDPVMEALESVFNCELIPAAQEKWDSAKAEWGNVALRVADTRFHKAQLLDRGGQRRIYERAVDRQQTKAEWVVFKHQLFLFFFFFFRKIT